MSGVLYEGWMILAALLPSIGLLYLFFVIIKHMIEGDRRERAAQRELDLRENRDAGDTSADTTPH
jgi:hypothetical protein